jgi:hypothetical protein
MPGRDHRRVVFIFEGGRSEVNQPNLSVKQDTSLPSNSLYGR